MSSLRRHAAAVGATVLAAAALTACAGATTSAARRVAIAPAAALAATTCSPPADASYPALASVPTTLPAGSLEAKIKARGYLVVGVAGDSRLLGARNQLSDINPAGFDVDVAAAIGRAIFGTDGKVHYKVITAGQRFPQVAAGADGGGVDMVARAVSMTCDRWAATFTDPAKATGSAFSSAYLESDQRLLVRDGEGDSLDALIATKKKTGSTATVCAPVGSTSLAKIQGKAGVTPIGVAIHSDCLALWQEGRVDAITGDDVVLAGFQAQDDTARIVGPALDTTPYGLAIAKTHPEFVQYVNAVMQTPEFRSAWTASYAKWLAAPLASKPKAFPPPNDTRPVG